MQIQVQPFTIHKRFPLTISRGTTAQTTNLWVKIQHEDREGWGEASPFSAGGIPQTTATIVQALHAIAPLLEPFSPWERQKIEAVLMAQHIPSAARAAVDVALHDWLGQRVGLPLWKVWGLDRDRLKPTSVTIGINTPESAQQRMQDWLQVMPVKALKIKLGNPSGIEADQSMFTAVRQVVPHVNLIGIDANGGWSLTDALKMSDWLAVQGVAYLEQPLPRGQEADLKELSQRSPLPIFADESCCNSQDIWHLADRVQGVNIKLMKCGGLTEAMRMIQVAKTCNLQVMLGCYSDSALANTAATHLAPLADYLDLDSHLNLVDDPFSAVGVPVGTIQLSDQPGLGVRKKPTC